MRVHRVYIESLRPGTLAISGPEAHHLSRVLRVRPGDSVRGFDGWGKEARGRVVSASEGRVEVALEAPVRSEREARLKVTLAVAMLKGDKMSEVVRQATELGAVRLVPVLSARAEVTVLSPNRLERWRRVAKEASKQSGRSLVPQVESLVALRDLARGEALGLVADPRAPQSLKDIDRSERAEVMVVTGPEGGLSPAEVEMLRDRGFRAVGLGPRILRAETAPVALLAALLLPEAS